MCTYPTLFTKSSFATSKVKEGQSSGWYLKIRIENHIVAVSKMLSF